MGDGEIIYLVLILSNQITQTWEISFGKLVFMKSINRWFCPWLKIFEFSAREKNPWRCRGLNPGPFTCKANALPLRYIPLDIFLIFYWHHTMLNKRTEIYQKCTHTHRNQLQTGKLSAKASLGRIAKRLFQK